VKTGDAKLWVYRRESGHDRQAAESHKVSTFVFIPPGLSKSGIFYRKAYSTVQTQKGLGMQNVVGFQFSLERTSCVCQVKHIQRQTFVIRKGYLVMNHNQTPSPAHLANQYGASLVVNKQVIPLSNEITRLGRHLENNIVFHEEFLSRYHAEIIFENGQYVLYDKNSTGGTFVNGKKIDRCILNSGDLISLANIQIMFVNNTSSLMSKSTGMTQGLEGLHVER
jgi:hypothetical protein